MDISIQTTWVTLNLGNPSGKRFHLAGNTIWAKPNLWEASETGSQSGASPDMLLLSSDLKVPAETYFRRNVLYWIGVWEEIHSLHMFRMNVVEQWWRMLVEMFLDHWKSHCTSRTRAVCSLLVSEQFTTKSAQRLHNLQSLFSLIQPAELKGHRLHQLCRDWIRRLDPIDWSD